MSHPDEIGVSFSNITQKGKLPGRARHDSVNFPFSIKCYFRIGFYWKYSP